MRQIAALAAVLGTVALVASACGSAPIPVNYQGAAEIPSPRTDASSANDEANGTIVMFGGANRSGVLAETWSWDGSVWRLQHPKHSPPVRERAVMAFDPASDRVVLFGGWTCPPPGPNDLIGCDNQTAKVQLSDTWSWDGSDWSRLETRSTPDITDFADLTVSAGADDAHHELILLSFGAPIPTANLETWTLKAGDWQRLQPQHAPPDAVFGGPAFDSASHQLVVQQSAGPHIDCFSAAPCGRPLTHDATWIWTGSDWQDLGVGVRTPHDNGDLVSVGNAGLLLIGIGGVVERWNGRSWTAASPAPWETGGRSGWTAAYSGPARQLVLFGGRSWGTNHLYGDTLGSDGNQWRTLARVVPSPSAGLTACSPAEANGGSGEGLQVPGAPDSIDFDLDFVEPHAGPCHLDVVVEFTLNGPDGKVLPIAGNPAQIEVVADLTFDRGAVWAVFTVTNACGLPQGGIAVFAAEGLNASEPATVSPCGGRSLPPMTVTASIVNRPPQKQ